MNLRYPFGVLYELERKKTKTSLVGPAIKFMENIHLNSNHLFVHTDSTWWQEKGGYQHCGRWVFNQNREINRKIDINDMYEKGSRQL